MSAAAGLKPDTILHQLSELWSGAGASAREDSPAGPGNEVLRACAMTVVAFVDDDNDPAATSKTLALVMRAHPSRAIVVNLSGGSGRLDSRVFAQCWKPMGRNSQICSEVVELTVSVDRVRDLASIVSPLKAADVPCALWFRSARISAAESIAPLLALGDKLIFDSAQPGAPDLADMRSLVNAGSAVGDLAWTRLTPLRQLIARIASGNPVEHVVVEHSGMTPAVGARYLHAWLRSGLTGARVDLQPSRSPGAGQVNTIRISPAVVIQVHPNCAEYEIGSMRQRAPLLPRREDELIDEELNIMRHDRIYEKALHRMTVWNPQS